MHPAQLLFRLICLSSLALPAVVLGQGRRLVETAPERSDRLALEGLQPAGTKRALIVCGHPGDKEHRPPFAEAVEKIRGALIAYYGFAEPDVRVEFGGPIAEGDGPVLSGVRGGATREEIETEVAELRQAL